MSEPNVNAIPTTRATHHSRTHKLTVTAMLSTVAFLLMFIEFPIPALIPAFVKLDISDLPELLAAFSLGPIYGVIVTLLKNVLFSVLHGSSSVPQEYVQMINEFGGAMPGAIGVPEDQLRQAARLAVCKINIDSDLRLAMTGTIRKYLAEHPAEFDPRKYLGPARENIKQLVKHKIVDVLGCDGKA